MDEALHKIYTTGNHLWLVRGCFTVCLTGAMMAIETNMLTFLVYCSEDAFDEGSVYGLFLVGGVVLGFLLGTVVFSPLGDIIGRWKILCWSSVGLVVMGALSAIAPNDWSFVLFRSLLSFCEGAWTVALTYLIELLPVDNRGVFVNSTNIAWGIGSVGVNGLAWAVIPSLGWRWFIAICVVPFALNLILLFMLCESPRWLLAQGREEEALESLKHIANVNGCEIPCDQLKPILSEDDMLVPIPMIVDGQRPGLSVYVKHMCAVYSELFNKDRKQLTLIIWAGMALIMSAYGAVVLYDADVLAEDLGYSTSETGVCSFNYSFIFWVSTSEIVGALLVMPTLDKPWLRYCGGRFGTQFISYVLTMIASILTGYLVSPVMLWAYISRGLITGGSGVYMIHVGELYGTKHRVTGMGAASLITYPTLGIAALIVYSGMGSSIIMWITTLAVLGGTICICYLPETAEVELH